jgi:CHAT domain-containing protein/Tfp pilus assembly protein PilF
MGLGLMRYSGKLLGVMVATVLWMPAAGMLHPEQTLAQEASSPDTEAAARLAEADRLFQRGIQYWNTGRFQTALQSWQQSLQLYRNPGVRAAFPQESRQGEAGSLNNAGTVYRNWGQYEEALNLHEQGLRLFQAIGHRYGEASALINMGIVYRRTGQYQNAISIYTQSLAIAREIGSRDMEGAVLGNLGNTHRNLGQYQAALQFHQQNLTLAREIGDRQGEGIALGNLGNVYYDLEQYQEAVAAQQQSLAIVREVGDRSAEASTLGNLGNAYTRLGQYQEAARAHEQSLVLFREMGNRQGEAEALGNLGNIYGSLGQSQRAMEYLGQLLSIVRQVGNRRSEADALNNLGLAALDLGQFASATDYFIDAIGVYESLRIADLPDAERISIFDTYLRSYLLLQRSLVAQNEPEQALVYAERGRARAFVELLATRITDNDNPDVASLESINSPDLTEIQRIAREQNATLVNYSVISDKSLFIWVIQPTGEIAFQQVDLGDRNLSELVSLVRETLGARSQDRATIAVELTPEEAERRQAQRQQQLQELHQLLIEPIAQYLPTDPTQRVIFIPHQDLFLVPFAALVDGNGDYLIEQHTILTAPSIQVLDLTYQQAIANNTRSARPTDLLVVGNPIMPSVWNPQTNQTQPLSNLPGAEREAIAIAKALDTEALLRDSASKATVMRQMPNARIIHLATHGLLEYGSPEDSGVLDVPGAIALAPSANGGGLLTAAEILQMDLNAELVVLSACDTGRGRITGDGVIGLSRAFVTAGVPSLMVSLWAVDDAATAEWMVTFYDQWQQTGDKAQAVRQAMLTTMENHPDPRLWAAFTLVGSAE